MLSSSPSLLLSALSPLSLVGEAAGTAAGEAAPGFAELLNGLAAKATEAVSSEQAGTGDRDEPAVGDQPAPVKDKAIAHAGRPTPARKTGDDTLAAGPQPATAIEAAIEAATETAIESGKILPVALPEAAKADAAVAEPAATPTPLPVLPGAAPLQAQTPESAPVVAAAAPSRRPAAAAGPALARKVNPTAPQPPEDKAKAEIPAGAPRAAQAVAITVAAPVPAVAQAAEAGTQPAAPVRSKAVRAADLVRVEAALPQVSAPAATPFAHADQSVPASGAPVAAMPAAMPSPRDIDAALDHLVAAREALMPAEAALAIEHAEFGEVSIRFEQSADGRLSAELTAADPELKRAVTAATAADRPATTAEGDGSRSAQLASQRGPTSGGDAAGGRSQSGGQPGAERDMPQRRTPTRSQAGHATTDQRPGIFA